MSLSNIATFTFDKSTSNLLFLAPIHSFRHVTTQGTHQEAMVISQRHVGIGTSTPSYSLDVQGDANISSNLYISGTLYAPSVTGISYFGGSLVRTTEVVATETKTVFTLNVDGIYDFAESDAHVYVNGLKLGYMSAIQNDYMLSYTQSGTTTTVTITLTEAVLQGDVVEISLGQPILGTRAISNLEVIRNVGIGVSVPSARLHITGGTNTLPSIRMGSGSLLSSATAGSLEYDGKALYMTPNTVVGRGELPVYHAYRYAIDGSAMGLTIADYFPANSSINLESSGFYEFDAMCYFSKATAGTLTWAWEFSSAVEFARSYFVSNDVGGFTNTSSTGAPVMGHVAQRTTTSVTHEATSSLANDSYHVYHFKAYVMTSNACNARLRVTCSAGTVTPRTGSFYKVRNIGVNSGNFAA